MLRVIGKPPTTAHVKAVELNGELYALVAGPSDNVWFHILIELLWPNCHTFILFDGDNKFYQADADFMRGSVRLHAAIIGVPPPSAYDDDDYFIDLHDRLTIKDRDLLRKCVEEYLAKLGS